VIKYRMYKTATVYTTMCILWLLQCWHVLVYCWILTRTCQHCNNHSIHIVVYTVAVYTSCILSLYSWDCCINTKRSFVLMSVWGLRFIAETCRVHMLVQVNECETECVYCAVRTESWQTKSPKIRTARGLGRSVSSDFLDSEAVLLKFKFKME
jgi:hypothetical protein